ncbi:hypothetical protein IF1G_01919 [Cordyceps javanica]|uniref:Uncharacterized protein n=1 Tax=Cordyceps javanica TaxID=43265 RepID=A0A545VDA5_9HYPO|nr:hypothetical protein IF1G_01919 [Cordyceps javanica]
MGIKMEEFKKGSSVLVFPGCVGGGQQKLGSFSSLAEVGLLFQSVPPFFIITACWQGQCRLERSWLVRSALRWLRLVSLFLLAAQPIMCGIGAWLRPKAAQWTDDWRAFFCAVSRQLNFAGAGEWPKLVGFITPVASLAQAFTVTISARQPWRSQLFLIDYLRIHVKGLTDHTICVDYLLISPALPNDPHMFGQRNGKVKDVEVLLCSRKRQARNAFS